ncbi:hypothetical protein [Duganella sp. CF517]|uniref:hypothetical protein n=1 Tax=Duganella sp. CF517 TaxID=1881038 RepID=UPI0015A6A2EA|nr:hypothetical protein [Duganella sp. CF517]
MSSQKIILELDLVNTLADLDKMEPRIVANSGECSGELLARYMERKAELEAVAERAAAKVASEGIHLALPTTTPCSSTGADFCTATADRVRQCRAYGPRLRQGLDVRGGARQLVSMDRHQLEAGH